MGYYWPDILSVRIKVRNMYLYSCLNIPPVYIFYLLILFLYRCHVSIYMCLCYLLLCPHPVKSRCLSISSGFSFLVNVYLLFCSYICPYLYIVFLIQLDRVAQCIPRGFRSPTSTHPTTQYPSNYITVVCMYH